MKKQYFLNYLLIFLFISSFNLFSQEKKEEIEIDTEKQVILENRNSIESLKNDISSLKNEMTTSVNNLKEEVEAIKSDIKEGNYYQLLTNTRIFELKPRTDFDIDAVLEYSELELKQLFPAVKSEGVIEAKKGWAFRVLKIDKDEDIIVIKFVNKDGYWNKFYGVSKSAIESNYEPYEGDNPRRSFVASAITIPIKIRPGRKDPKEGERERLFDFEGNINLGATAGFRTRLDDRGKKYLDLLVGITFGSTKVTTLSGGDSVDENRSILTPFLGAVYEYDDFQAGLFVGWDHLNGELSKTWVYQAKPWIGVGIGYNIFTTKDNDGNEGANP